MKKGASRYFGVLALFIIIALLMGCGLIANQEDINFNICDRKAESQLNDCNNKTCIMGVLEKRDSCYNVWARETANISICKRILDSDIEYQMKNPDYNNCIINVVFRTENMSVCHESVEGTFPKEYEIDNCIISYAYHMNDLDACNLVKISKIRDQCYSNIANIRNDTEICTNITNDLIKDICNKDSYLLFIDEIAGEGPELKNYSARLVDITGCHEINDKDEQSKCYGDYLEYIMEKNDSTLCENFLE